ncbi:MAG: ATP-binding cassette domain-containing protein [Desulfovibrionales bacterium]
MRVLETPYVRLDRVSVSRGGTPILRNITWEGKPGENWVIVGPNGAGKSSFLRLVRGDLWPDQDGIGQRRYYHHDRPGPSPLGFREHTALVSAEFQDAYVRMEIDLPVLEVVRSGFYGTVRPLAPAGTQETSRVLKTLQTLGLTHLRDRTMLSLSRGEGRKILLARALVTNPALLFLDEPLAGLDRESRTEVLQLVDQMAASGRGFVMATHRFDEVPRTVNRIVTLKQGSILHSGPFESRPPAPKNRNTPLPPPVRSGKELIRLQRATVSFQGTVVLDEITWTLRKGEHWALLGPNGSGKTTLLKLLMGMVQATSEHAVLRLLDTTSTDLREIRRSIGFVSPEYQAGMDGSLSVREVVTTGFFAAARTTPFAPTRRHRHKTDSVLEELGLTLLAGKRLHELSYGQLRKILLARAIVNDPELLLLDEPLSGLDPESRTTWRTLLNRIAPRTTLVMSSHHQADLPECISHVLALDCGRTRFKGNISDYFLSGLSPES